MIDQIMILLLMLDAAWVAYGLYRKNNMWKWVVLYWTILTTKNLFNFVSSI